MSINDPIILKYNPNRQQYFFSQGTETFYDNENHWIEFDTMEDALSFGFDNFGVFKMDDNLLSPEPILGGRQRIPPGQMKLDM